MLTPEQIQQIRGRIGIQPQESNRASELEAAWSQTPETPTEKPGILSQYMSASKKTGEMIGKGGAAVLGALTSSERGLGHTIGETAAANTGTIESATQNKINEADMQMRVQRRIAEKKKLGEDTSDLEWALMRAQQGPTVEESITETTPSVNKTTGQVAGELGGTALDALSFGTYGAAAKGMQAGKLASKAPSVAGLAGQILPKSRTPLEIMKGAGKASLVGGGVGYGYDVSMNLQEGKEGAAAAMPGLGTFLGASIPLAAGVLSAGKQVIKPSPEAALRDYKSSLDDIFGGKESGRKMLERTTHQGKNPADFLTQKAAMGDQVPIDVVDGVYKTQAGQDKLWNDVSHLDDMLTEGLKSSPERLSLKELEKEVLQSIANNPDIKAAGTSLEAQRKARKIFINLRASHPDRIPLDVANEIKSGQWKEARSLFSKMQPNYAGSTNFQIGQTLKGAIEKKMGDAPVKALNEVIGQHITAAEALSKLDNSVAKGGKIGKYFFRSIGAIAGSHGGPAGTILGAGAGEVAARVAQQIPANNPFRAAVLAKLGQSSPKVVRQFAEYLAREEAARVSRLKLPAGDPSKVAIPMGAPVGKSGVEVIPAQKGPVGVDPKTGRFMKTYSSDPNSVGGMKAGGLNNPQANTPTNTSASSVIADTIPQNPTKDNDFSERVFYRAQPSGEGLIPRPGHGSSAMFGNAPHFATNEVEARMYGNNIKRFSIKPEANVKTFNGTFDLFKTVNDWADKTHGQKYRMNTETNSVIDRWAKENKIDALYVDGQEGAIFNPNAIVDKTPKSSAGTPLKNQGSQAAYGGAAGIEFDEEGNPRFNPEKAAMGILGIGALKSKTGQKVVEQMHVLSKNKIEQTSVADSALEEAFFGKRLSKQKRMELKQEGLRRYLDGQRWKYDPELKGEEEVLSEILYKIDSYKVKKKLKAHPSENITPLSEKEIKKLKPFLESVTESADSLSSSLANMSEKEINEISEILKRFQTSSKPLKIYRGMSKEESLKDALSRPSSWTTDKEVARAFKDNVEGGEGWIAEITIDRDNVLLNTNEVPDSFSDLFGITDDEAEVIVKPQFSQGKTTLGTVIGGALAAGSLAGLNPRELEYVKMVRNEQSEAPQVSAESLKKAIAFNETNSVKGNKYALSKPSGIEEYGNDNGKYQITDAELKSYSKRFLGHNVTPREFLASPTLQELYMDGKIKWLSENYGWGPEEILASHRGGLSKPDEIEDLKKKKKDYIENGMSIYSSN